MGNIITTPFDFSSVTPLDYPPIGSHLMAIDLDGQLKKMDSDGVITFVESKEHVLVDSWNYADFSSWDKLDDLGSPIGSPSDPLCSLY